MSWLSFSFLGNPAIGILKHKGKCYVFSSKEAAYIFAQDPDKFIQLNVEKAKEYAELIQLLELRHQFEYLVPHAQVHTAHASCWTAAGSLVGLSFLREQMIPIFRKEVKSSACLKVHLFQVFRVLKKRFYFMSFSPYLFIEE